MAENKPTDTSATPPSPKFVIADGKGVVVAAPDPFALHADMVAATLRRHGGIGHKRSDELAKHVIEALGKLGWLKAPG